MKPSALKKSLSTLIAIKQPTMIWGSPGIAKSAVVAQAAKEYGGELIDLRLASLEASEVRFLMNVEKGKLSFERPYFIPATGKGVIFFDEFVQAPTVIQNAARQLILDRRSGQHILGPDWAMVAAGNRDTDRAATNRMPSHIANNFVHLEMEVDATDWLEWAQANGINDMVVAFIAFRPLLLNVFDPKAKAYPTPRSWEFVSKILNAGTLDEGLFDVITGTIGQAAAAEFIAFIRVFREMPDFETIKKRPEGTKIPENVAARYAVATMLSRLTQQGDMAAVMKYINRMSKEFQILTCNEMTKLNPRLSETSSYIAWSVQNKDLLMNATVR